jgi:predicted ATPase/DNA-binding winged helix-turn-helix (wHTH) protein
VLRFADFEVDLDRRTVVRSGEPQHLEPQAFDLLAYLIAQRARVVPKTELLDELWGHRFVSESALTTRVKEIRRALGDDGTRQAVIKNERGRGYRFVAEPLRGSGERSSHLFGRDRDLGAVLEALDESPLVTIVGAGGVGKTTLAKAVVRFLDHRPRDGAWFVDLASVANADAAMNAVSRAAGLTDAVTTGDVARAIAGLDALVVLDNCDHLVAAAAAFVQELLDHAALVRVLATSRERLGVAGERVWSLAPLDRDAAVALFIDRAQSAQREFDSENRADLIEELVTRLDCLPLAIEMAAARLSSIGLVELYELIDERMDVLRSPHRDVSRRHATLGAVVAWSEELLRFEERAVFTDFAAFAGPVPAADAIGVLAPGSDRADVVDVVSRLVDRSLLEANTSSSPTTYRMLGVVKTQVANKMSSDLPRRHAEWFVEVAAEADDQLRTPAEPQAYERLEIAAAELRLAHAWARRRDPQLAARLVRSLQLHAFTRLWREPAAWARSLLGVLDDDDPRAPALWATLAADAEHSGQLESARGFAQRVVDASDVRAVAAALETLGDVAMYEGDLAASAAWTDRLWALGESVGDVHAMVTGVAGRALALAYGGDPTGAMKIIDTFDTTIALAPSDEAWLAYCRGEALSAEDPAAAVAAFERAMELADSVGNRFAGGVVRVSLASVHARAGDPDDAVDAFADILDHWRRHGSVTHAVTTLRNLVELLVRMGEDQLAMTLLGALSTASVQSPYGEAEMRLDAATSEVSEHVGDAMVSAWMSNGAQHDVHWALETALARTRENRRGR